MTVEEFLKKLRETGKQSRQAPVSRNKVLAWIKDGPEEMDVGLTNLKDMGLDEKSANRIIEANDQ